MKISVCVDGKKFYSIDKPKMKHLRMGGKLISIQEKMDDGQELMQEYLIEIYSYIKDTFPKICDEDIDKLSTDKFMVLVADIARWANGGQDEQKKN